MPQTIVINAIIAGSGLPEFRGKVIVTRQSTAEESFAAFAHDPMCACVDCCTANGEPMHG